MSNEFSFLGVLVPSLMGLMVLAFGVLVALRWVLQRAGVYRHVWHPPLFNLALYVLVLGALFSIFSWCRL